MFAGQDLRLGFYLLLSLSRIMQLKSGIEMDGVSDKSDLISFHIFLRLDWILLLRECGKSIHISVSC